MKRAAKTKTRTSGGYLTELGALATIPSEHERVSARVLAAVADAQGNRAAAAEALGVSYRQWRRILARIPGLEDRIVQLCTRGGWADGRTSPRA